MEHDALRDCYWLFPVVKDNKEICRFMQKLLSFLHMQFFYA